MFSEWYFALLWKWTWPYCNDLKSARLKWHEGIHRSQELSQFSELVWQPKLTEHWGNVSLRKEWTSKIKLQESFYYWIHECVGIIQVAKLFLWNEHIVKKMPGEKNTCPLDVFGAGAGSMLQSSEHQDPCIILAPEL